MDLIALTVGHAESPGASPGDGPPDYHHPPHHHAQRHHLTRLIHRLAAENRPSYC